MIKLEHGSKECPSQRTAGGDFMQTYQAKKQRKSLTKARH
jgi:hypothetical protein